MDEKLKILKMVEAGTVTAQQAADMMAEADQAEPRSIEPVSYTHLDVYKRQLHSLAYSSHSSLR